MIYSRVQAILQRTLVTFHDWTWKISQRMYVYGEKRTTNQKQWTMTTLLGSSSFSYKMRSAKKEDFFAQLHFCMKKDDGPNKVKITLVHHFWLVVFLFFPYTSGLPVTGSRQSAVEDDLEYEFIDEYTHHSTVLPFISPLFHRLFWPSCDHPHEEMMAVWSHKFQHGHRHSRPHCKVKQLKTTVWDT